MTKETRLVNAVEIFLNNLSVPERNALRDQFEQWKSEETTEVDFGDFMLAFWGRGGNIATAG